MKRSCSQVIGTLLAAMAIAGCASGLKGRPGGAERRSGGASLSAPRAPSGKRPSSGSVSGFGEVAETTRAVTEKRRGSWSLTSEKVRDVAPLVRRAAAEHHLPEDLIYGIIWVESRFNPEAVSPVGARGLMQLMPRTAGYLAECIDWSGRVRSFDPEFNVAAGAFYISKLIKSFDGDVDLALAAYNAGPSKVRRWLADDGLPKVSVEYATMVQTARGFFGGGGRGGSGGSGGRPGAGSAPSAAAPITDDALDRLGLAILIAGLSDTQFGLEREDDAHPF